MTDTTAETETKPATRRTTRKAADGTAPKTAATRKPRAKKEEAPAPAKVELTAAKAEADAGIPMGDRYVMDEGIRRYTGAHTQVLNLLSPHKPADAPAEAVQYACGLLLQYGAFCVTHGKVSQHRALRGVYAAAVDSWTFCPQCAKAFEATEKAAQAEAAAA
jgi:hypothetical protein